MIARNLFFGGCVYAMLLGEQCKGLKNKTSATSAETCAELCCADSSCTTWQWDLSSAGLGCWAGHGTCAYLIRSLDLYVCSLQPLRCMPSSCHQQDSAEQADIFRDVMRVRVCVRVYLRAHTNMSSYVGRWTNTQRTVAWWHAIRCAPCTTFPSCHAACLGRQWRKR